MTEPPPLPHCNELYVRFFVPWYREDKDRAGTCTKPDFATSNNYKGKQSSDLTQFSPEHAETILNQIKTMTRAAESDFSTFLNVSKPMSFDWVAVADTHFDHAVIRKIIDRSDPTDFTNDYVITCCEFGAMLAVGLIERCPALQWIPDWPYWDSQLLDPRSGTVIPPFHWAIKKMSDYGVDDGFAAKIIVCAAMLDEEAEK